VLDLTAHPVGISALVVFVVAYGAVILEEQLGLRKSVPVLLSAGLIWILVAVAYGALGSSEAVAEAIRHNLLEYAELLLFLIVAMTYVNTLGERGVFDALRSWLLNRGLSYRALFWATGGLAFVISPFADNLTTALVMGAVAIAMGAGNPRFVGLACINIVVAANAGGAFSPFGDITTLMVWQKGLVPFTGFFPLFVPSLLNWLVPAACMAMAVGPGRPDPVATQPRMEPGAMTAVGLFIGTIATTVLLHSALHLPPAAGMMLGLGALKLYSYLLNRRLHGDVMTVDEPDDVFAETSLGLEDDPELTNGEEARTLIERSRKPLDPFRMLEQVEWDTLLFFYGVVLSVGGLGALGYLAVTSRLLYDGLGTTTANILMGLLSAIIDNVPIMFAVLSMNPPMSTGQWLLVTLTAGVGGSLLSIGSAAGVALMGQSQGTYTFMSHLKWSWAVALGYAVSIVAHLVLNRHLF
jgi:Na+/H+ antiporter NhaD/arsenite permease-like protein